MNAIMGFSDLLTDNFDDKVKLQKFATIIRQRSADLLELINEILDLSKIETGQLPVNIEDCMIPHLFEELHEFFVNYRENLRKDHVEIRIKYDTGLPFNCILTDIVKLKQIFINLIQNALKFTDCGYVEFGCLTDRDNKLVFFVTDTGMGIPEDKQSFIFERFTQLPPIGSNTQSGTGLGLAIVKGLVELLDGKIEVQSAPYKGSTFYFSVLYQVPGARQINLTKQKTPDLKVQWKEYSVLLVEDDKFNAEYIKEILEHTGITLIRATNAAQAIDIVSSGETIHLILMDIGLPDMDGYEAIATIKAIRPDVKIIVQTAYATNKDKCKAYEVGCQDYISKPIGKNMLIARMQEQIEN
jgi:CheY-like chemotaxis protein